MDEQRIQSVCDSLKSEIRFLNDKDQTIPTDCYDAVVFLRAHVNQLINCYATTSVEHALNIVRRAGAHVQGFFALNKEDVAVRPRDPYVSFGHCVIQLDQAAKRAEEALGRDGRGDARSQLMNVLAIIVSCMYQFGAPDRKGYEE